MLEGIIEEGLTPKVPTDYPRWRPLHWVLAVPDVIARGGFDAVIGNPPFVTGSDISGAMGGNVRSWIVETIAAGKKGNADLVAYFFLRAMNLTTPAGTIGLIATNSVAQGRSREVGLDQMEAAGFEITRSIQSRRWPAGASLRYAAVWGTRGDVSTAVPRISDDVPVGRITTLLEPAGRVSGKPSRLVENSGIAFEGCKPSGKGFVVVPAQAVEWVRIDGRNEDVLLPYLNGKDLNSRQDLTASRWVVDFGMRSESVSARYVAPFKHVETYVKPQREQGAIELRSKPWWLFERSRPAMRKAIHGLEEVLVIALTSETVMPVRVRTAQVFSNSLGVFATNSYSTQAVLSSSLHQLWAITYGSGMQNDPRYTPSDVFETFPRPTGSDKLDVLGKKLDTERRETMLRRPLGLTKLYGHINDPATSDSVDADVARLRQIHLELDEAVMAAYGWGDVSLDYGFHTYRQMERWTVSPAARIVILDRLLEENHRRAAQQGAVVPAPDESEDGE